MNEIIADSAEIKFECSQCGQSLSVDSSGAGITIKCPTCDSPVVVPQLRSIHDRHYGEDLPAESGRADFPAVEELELRAELAEAVRRSEELEEELTAAQNAAAHSERRAVAVEKQLGEAREKISQIGAALAAEEETRAQWEAASAQAGERADSAAAELFQRDADLTEVRAQLAESAQALALALEEVVTLQGAGEELRGQLENARVELQSAAATSAALAAAEENLAARQRALEVAEADRQTLSSQSVALRQEADTLRRDLSEIHTGRELLELRARFLALETEHQRATGTLGRIEAEAKTLSASEQQLRAELSGTRDRAAEAERRADAASETALSKDNEVLRGIIDRQKGVLEESFTELRRLRRARLFLRILYTLATLALIGLAALAVDYLPDAVKGFLHEWFGIH